LDRLFLCKKNGSDRVAPESSDALTVSEPYIPGRYQKMSKGGGHIWSNVQVAHIICNSIKSDKAVGE
jgi:hypothetical protein